MWSANAVGGEPPPSRASRKRLWRDASTFALFAGPNLVLLGVFTFRPIVYSLWVSLTSWRLPGHIREFVGFQNYARLTNDPEVLRVLGNTLVYSLTVVVTAQVLAFLVALALHKQRRGAAFFRMLVFTPHVTLTVAAAIAWLLVLDPIHGPAAEIYNAFGVEGPRWLGSSQLALPALMLVGAWREVGFATIFFLAGLQTLPELPYEAARLEGVGPWREVFHLTVPLMSPVIYFLAVSGLIAAFKTFDTVAVMTQGGPVYPDSSLFVYHLYRAGFRGYEIGYASALANVFWAIMLGLALLQLRGSRRWVFYDS